MTRTLQAHRLPRAHLRHTLAALVLAGLAGGALAAPADVDGKRIAKVAKGGEAGEGNIIVFPTR